MEDEEKDGAGREDGGAVWRSSEEEDLHPALEEAPLNMCTPHVLASGQTPVWGDPHNTKTHFVYCCSASVL